MIPERPISLEGTWGTARGNIPVLAAGDLMRAGIQVCPDAVRETWGPEAEGEYRRWLRKQTRNAGGNKGQG